MAAKKTAKTPHITANKDEVAKTVIMPGDPLRAKWIAEKFLENPRLINEVRGMLGYTGLYKGRRITVMGHGMGIPSIGIYSYELMKFYEAKYIIRVGSCGALLKKLHLGDVIVATDAWSESSYAKLMKVPAPNQTLPASPSLVDLARKHSRSLGIAVHEGTVVSEDAFYQSLYKPATLAKKTKALAVEMEAFGLYANAIKLRRLALTLLTVSDSLITKETMPAADRQTTLADMVKLALEMGADL